MLLYRDAWVSIFTAYFDSLKNEKARVKVWCSLRLVCRDWNAHCKSFQFPETFFWASRNGKLELLQFLMSFTEIDPSIPSDGIRNWAIQEACWSGRDKIVDFLLKDPRVDPTGRDFIALTGAIKGGHIHVMKILLKHPQITCRLEEINKEMNLFQMAALNHYKTRGNPLGCQLEVLLEETNLEPPPDLLTFLFNLGTAILDEHLIRILLDNPKVGGKENDESLIRRTKKGHFVTLYEMVKMEKFNVSVGQNIVLRTVIASRLSSEFVPLILKHPKFDPKELPPNDIGWIVRALTSNEEDHLKYILNDHRIDPKDDEEKITKYLEETKPNGAVLEVLRQDNRTFLMIPPSIRTKEAEMASNSIWGRLWSSLRRQ